MIKNHTNDHYNVLNVRIKILITLCVKDIFETSIVKEKTILGRSYNEQMTSLRHQ